jgi:hypothetical protein
MVTERFVAAEIAHLRTLAEKSFVQNFSFAVRMSSRSSTITGDETWVHRYDTLTK